VVISSPHIGKGAIGVDASGLARADAPFVPIAPVVMEPRAILGFSALRLRRVKSTNPVSATAISAFVAVPSVVHSPRPVDVIITARTAACIALGGVVIACRCPAPARVVRALPGAVRDAAAHALAVVARLAGSAHGVCVSTCAWIFIARRVPVGVAAAGRRVTALILYAVLVLGARRCSAFTRIIRA